MATSKVVLQLTTIMSVYTYCTNAMSLQQNVGANLLSQADVKFHHAGESDGNADYTCVATRAC